MHLILQIVPGSLGNKDWINPADLYEINIGGNSCENAMFVTLYRKVCPMFYPVEYYKTHFFLSRKDHWLLRHKYRLKARIINKPS